MHRRDSSARSEYEALRTSRRPSAAGASLHLPPPPRAPLSGDPRKRRGVITCRVPREGAPSGERPARREGPGGGGAQAVFPRPKVCKFSTEKIDMIDYKDVRLVSEFVAERGKILPPPHRHLLNAPTRAVGSHQSPAGTSPCCRLRRENDGPRVTGNGVRFTLNRKLFLVLFLPCYFVQRIALKPGVAPTAAWCTAAGK